MDRDDLSESARSYYDAEMRRNEKAKRQAMEHRMERLTTSAIESVYGVSADAVRQAHRHGRITPTQVLTDTGGKRHNLWRPEDVVELWGCQADPDALTVARKNGFVMNGWLILSRRPAISIEYWHDQRGGHAFRATINPGEDRTANSTTSQLRY